MNRLLMLILFAAVWLSGFLADDLWQLVVYLSVALLVSLWVES